jgi:hypothetical protein
MICQKRLESNIARISVDLSDKRPASGFMTAREVMQVVGSDFCRRMDQNCWARALYTAIEEEPYSIAIVADCRFPNEVTLGTEREAKVIRLTRKIFDDEHLSEKALDNFPLGEYSLVIDNQNLTIHETHKTFKPTLYSWFSDYKLI